MSKKRLVLEGLGGDFSVNSSDMLLFGKQMSVPDDSELRHCILEERRNSAYAMRQGGNKLYRNLWEKLLMERYEERCGRVCLQVLNLSTSQDGASRTGMLMQILPITEWKGETSNQGLRGWIASLHMRM